MASKCHGLIASLEAIGRLSTGTEAFSLFSRDERVIANVMIALTNCGSMRPFDQADGARLNAAPRQMTAGSRVRLPR